MSGGPTRVLVVEDSLTVRKRIVAVLSSDPDVTVIAEATDGREAIELCRRLRPDVITLDMMLPVMSGLAATEYIMAYCPTPIVIVSASTNRAELFRTYEALAAGAIDVLEKPLGGEADGTWEARLVSTVKVVSRIKPITHPRARLRTFARSPAPVVTGVPSRVGPVRALRAIAIGGSTGSPAAVVEILRALPRQFPVPILLVIHLSETFAISFAEWLDSQSSVRVRFAVDGEPLPDAGVVLIAPAGRHLVVVNGVTRLTAGAERHFCRPSVDVLFESIARDLDGAGVVACLLTGMGRDGAAGLLALRRAGALTIAQDEATSAVWGMPREAVLLDAADRVLPLSDIGPALVEMARAAASVP